jgi:uncharacterized delta-60 repeat protein
MSGSVKVGGVYKDVAPYVKVGGAWKFAPEAWSKVSGIWKKWFLAGGLNDSEFNTIDYYSGPNYAVSTIAVQSDGKIIVGGAFNKFNGVLVNYIVRVNSDGTRDTAFAANTGANVGANNNIYKIAIQSDGKIIVVGGFNAFNGTLASYIVRLNSDGTRDTTFTTNAGTAANNEVITIAVQSDGKIIVGGAFTTFNGVTVNGIVRLNSDGTQDTTFTTNAGTGAGGTTFRVMETAIQSDGKIIISGYFTTFNGVTVNGIVRLNSDGTQDTTFTTNTGTGAGGSASNTNINSIAVQSDGKILLGGDFTTFNGITAYYIFRLNSDGTRDTTFTTNTGTGAGSAVLSIAVQSDDKILVGGQFGYFNDIASNCIVRLNSDGTRDTTFATNIGTGAEFNGEVSEIVVQSNGQIIVGGFFEFFNGTAANNIVKLDANGVPIYYGTISGAANTINAVAIQSDNKIIIGGQFSTFNGVSVNGIARLNSDGTLDTAFKSNTGTGAASTFISAVALQSDGKIILGGQFTSFNGATVNRIVRLNSDGTQDTTFTTNAGTAANSTVNSIAIQSDGKIVVGGQFTTFNTVTVNRIVRLNSNGTRDTTFTDGTGTGANGIISAVAVQSDGKIVVGGQFTTFRDVTVNRIVRLNSDGTRDVAFRSLTGDGASGTVSSIAIQSDGKIILVGGFATFNGVTVNRIVRLNSDGTRDTAFTSNTGTGAPSSLNTAVLQNDGKIIIGGLTSVTTFNGASVSCIFRLNSNGTLDTAFTTNTGTGPDVTVNCIAIQSDNKIIIGGQFTSFNRITRTRLAKIGGDLAA